MVRIDLSGRAVGGWVVELGPEPVPGVRLKPVRKISGIGPSPEIIELARWAAWRWVGRTATFLRTASPDGVVRSRAIGGSIVAVDGAPTDPVTRAALAGRRVVVRLPPAADRYALVRASAAEGHTLVLCPRIEDARRLGERLRRDGMRVAVLASDRAGAASAGAWARAATGATVVGARAAAWAPVGGLRRIIVLDEHDEGYQQEGSPTWHARDVAIERARRAGVPCVLVSPCPSLEALGWGELVVPDRSTERKGWGVIEVVDRREEDPTKGGLWSDRLVRLARGPGRVVCVLNRKGRARLLACARCGELARCEVCEASVEQLDGEVLRCRRCATERPLICTACGSGRLKNLRVGVTRAREELEALVGEPVAEVTASTLGGPPPDARVVVGTEAVLHRVHRADVVAFLDADQELSAPRYRAAEQALTLFALAARLVRGRDGGGRVLVQTRMPDHHVLRAVVGADPGPVAESEAVLRNAMRFPPMAALALVAGAGAEEFMTSLGRPDGIEVLGPDDDRWLVRAADHRTLCDTLGRVPRPAGRLRLEVDPLRI
jgi:primosomal protein N' (replication factor Y)